MAFRIGLRTVGLLLLGADHSRSAESFERLDRLLPQQTLAFVSCKNVPRTIERWQRARLRSPLANPTLQCQGGKDDGEPDICCFCDRSNCLPPGWQRGDRAPTPQFRRLS